jgi:hypothetical protein
VNKRGSEEGLYGLKSSRIGLECVSSRMISNVSIYQREARANARREVREGVVSGRRSIRIKSRK